MVIGILFLIGLFAFTCTTVYACIKLEEQERKDKRSYRNEYKDR